MHALFDKKLRSYLETNIMHIFGALLNRSSVQTCYHIIQCVDKLFGFQKNNMQLCSTMYIKCSYICSLTVEFILICSTIAVPDHTSGGSRIFERGVPVRD